MVRRFCPKCGKSVDTLVQTENGLFCEECANALLPLIQIGDRFDFYECGICKRVSATGSSDSWIPIGQQDPQNRLQEIILRLFLLKSIAKLDVQVDIDIPADIGGSEKCPPFDAYISIKSSKNEEKMSKFTVFVKPHYVVCTNCSRRRGHYFTATLQIRGELLSDSTMKENLLNEVEKYAKDLEGKNQEMFVAKVVQERQGFDLQLSTLHMALLLSTHIKNKYGAKLEESKRLMGLGEDGGEVYRYTILVHLLPYKKDFVIFFEGEPCLVVGINSKITTLFGLERKITFRRENKVLFSHPPKIIATPGNFLTFELISEDQTFLHLIDTHTGATISELKSNFPQKLPIGSTIYGIRVNDKTFFFSQIEA
ncbi:MAG: NMD3 family protein [Promethearchaeota archaeon CR_4]|nr:MAG: NMD3 family protein [Candidatus Lokiarchaeota archaeon CR_4]